MTRILMTLTVAMVLALSGFSTAPVFATESTSKVKVEVNGLVCDFCARALEKTFKKMGSVEDISVNLTTKIITIDLKEGSKLTDTDIKKAVNDAGYAIKEIQR